MGEKNPRVDQSGNDLLCTVQVERNPLDSGGDFLLVYIHLQRHPFSCTPRVSRFRGSSSLFNIGINIQDAERNEY